MIPYMTTLYTCIHPHKIYHSLYNYHPVRIYKPAETVSLNLNTYRRQKVNVSLNFHCFHFYCLTQDIRQVSLGSRTNYDPELECE